LTIFVRKANNYIVNPTHGITKMRTKIVKLAESFAALALRFEKLFRKLGIDGLTYCPEPSAFIILDAELNIIAEKDEHGTLKHLASLNKAFVARVYLSKIRKGEISPGDQMPLIETSDYPWDLAGETVGENIYWMLKKSSNTATNLLIDHIGGLEAINQELQELGFTSTSLHSYTLPSSYEPIYPHQKSISNAYDVGKALIDIYLSANPLFLDPMVQTPYQYAHSNRLINKVAVKSDIFGNGSVFHKDGKVYCAIVFYNDFPQWLIKVFTLTSEILSLQKSMALILKWDPISSFIQRFINTGKVG
jgi:D-alanyl-D-alanine carboxypeptidase